jgi:hypothetical protein
MFRKRHLLFGGILGCLVATGAPAQPVFTNVAAGAGVERVHTGREYVDIGSIGLGAGAVWFDYDGDGDLDLYVTQRVGANHLFRNDGGVFTDVAALVGADDAAHDGAGAAAADYDNDGDLDLFLANADADVLLENTGGAFVDVTATAFPDAALLDARGTSASWGDYDTDGFLDLFVANHIHLGGFIGDRQDRLFHNNGDGTFTDVSTLLDTNELIGFAFIGGWTDFDDDGDLDLFLINDCPFGGVATRPTKLFRNDGGIDGESWLFTEVSAEVGADHCHNGMGLAVGDYNGDGRLDYFYTNIGQPLLLENRGGVFTDQTLAAGIDAETVPGGGDTLVSWGTNFLDADLDGWEDLLFVAGTISSSTDEYRPQPDRFYLNNGDGTFTDLSDAAGLADTLTGRSPVFGDYDRDGDPDLFVVNYGETTRLWRNDYDGGNHWLIVELEGVAGNRDGIGAHLTLRTPDGREQIREIRSGSSLGGGDDLAAYFGLGANTTADELKIRWPSGIVQTLTGVSADQRLRVVEEGVRVTATPSVWPVEIAAGGGSIVYTLTLENHTATTQVLDVWITIGGPGVNVTRGPVPVTLAVNGRWSKTLTQTVPGGVPGGSYTLEAQAGSFPIATQSDAFPFEKAAAKGGVLPGVEAWGGPWETGLSGPPETPPRRFRLAENYPNPFNPETVIAYDVGADGPVRLAVYDVLGREVAVLVSEVKPAGAYRATWDGRDASGAPVPSGMYVYRMEAPGFVQTRPMMLVK